MSPLMQLLLFAAKTFIVIICIVFVLLIFLIMIAAISKGKRKEKGKLVIKNINQKYHEQEECLLTETLSKKEHKQFLKERKLKQKKEGTEKKKNVFIINFHGDIKASQVHALTEEINAILTVATKEDEVFVKIESGGGVVHGYGLAAAQLMRLKAKNIPLIVGIDKVAASGGYLMACVADRILAAPFAIIGSIGVIVQLPNFHRYLKDKHIDFEQLTAGEYKRTITLFGENTKEGKEKLKEEIEDVHRIFKNLIKDHRKQIDINRVATGEHWLATQCLDLQLVDEIKTSDDYLLEKSKDAKLFEICFEEKKPLMSKFFGGGHNSAKFSIPYLA